MLTNKQLKNVVLGATRESAVLPEGMDRAVQYRAVPGNKENKLPPNRDRNRNTNPTQEPVTPPGVISWARDLMDGSREQTRKELRHQLAAAGVGREEKALLHAALLKEAAKTDLGAFAQYVFGWRAARHHRIMLRAMEETTGNVCIIAPPGSAKTNYIGIAGTLWQIIKDTSIRVCYLSGTKEQAHRPSVLMRDTIENSEPFRSIFPLVTPNYNLGWAENRWFVNREVSNLKDPTMKSVGSCNQIEGSRVDYYLWDDLCTRENQATAETRAALNNWVIQVALTRLRPGGRIVNVMTRYGKNDIMKLIEEMGDFTVLRMPALGFWESMRGEMNMESATLLSELEPGNDTKESPIQESVTEYLHSQDSPAGVVVEGLNGSLRHSKNSNFRLFMLPESLKYGYKPDGINHVSNLSWMPGTWNSEYDYSPVFSRSTPAQSDSAQQSPNFVLCVENKRGPAGQNSPIGVQGGGMVEAPPEGAPRGMTPDGAAGGIATLGLSAEVGAAIEHATVQLDTMEVAGFTAPKGGSLWPEYFSRQEYLKVWKLSPELFEQTYQGNPTVKAGSIFKSDWWQFYQRGEGKKVIPEAARMVIMSIDTAFGTKTQNDYSVNLVGALGVSGIVYIVDMYMKRVKFPELVRDTYGIIQHWGPDRVLIENRGSGISLIQTLSLETMAPIIGINPDGDKLRRAHSVTPFIQAGSVMLPEDAPWKDDFIEQMSDFPHGEHDDIVDTVTQMLNWLIENSLILLEGRILQTAGGYISTRDGKGTGLDELNINLNPILELSHFHSAPYGINSRDWLDI